MFKVISPMCQLYLYLIKTCYSQMSTKTITNMIIVVKLYEIELYTYELYTLDGINDIITMFVWMEKTS